MGQRISTMPSMLRLRSELAGSGPVRARPGPAGETAAPGAGRWAAPTRFRITGRDGWYTGTCTLHRLYNSSLPHSQHKTNTSLYISPGEHTNIAC